MASVEGTAKLDLDANKFTSEANIAANAIENVGTEGERTGVKIDRASKKIASGQLRATASVVGFTTSVIGAGFAAGSLVDRQTALDQANLKVQKSLEKVKKLTDDNKQDTVEYSFALEQLRINQEKVTRATTDITRAQVNLALTFVTMITSTLPNMILSLKGVTIGTAVAAKSTAVLSGANVALGASVKGLTASMLTNPLFIIPTLAAIGIGVAILATGILDVKNSVDLTTQSMQAGTPVINTYSNALDPNLTRSANNAATALSGLAEAQVSFTAANKEFIQDLKGQFSDKTVGFSGAIDFYKKQDEFLSQVKTDFDLLTDKGFNIKNIVTAITEAHGEQAKAVGFTTRELERQVIVYAAIERALARIAEAERLRANEKKKEVNEIKTIASGNIIDRALENLNAQLGDAINNPEDYPLGFEQAIRAKINQVRSFSNRGLTRFATPSSFGISSGNPLGGNRTTAFSIISKIAQDKGIGQFSVSEFSANELASLAGLGAGANFGLGPGSIGNTSAAQAAASKAAGLSQASGRRGRRGQNPAITGLSRTKAELAALNLPFISASEIAAVRTASSRFQNRRNRGFDALGRPTTFSGSLLASNFISEALVRLRLLSQERVQSFIEQSGLTARAVIDFGSTPQGLIDLNNIVAFEDRKLLEASTV